MWVGQAEFIYFLGASELSWGSGFIYIYPYPPIYPYRVRVRVRVRARARVRVRVRRVSFIRKATQMAGAARSADRALGLQKLGFFI